MSVAFLAYLFLVPLWLGVNQAWSTSAYIELKTIKEGGPNVADAFNVSGAGITISFPAGQLQFQIDN